MHEPHGMCGALKARKVAHKPGKVNVNARKDEHMGEHANTT